MAMANEQPSRAILLGQYAGFVTRLVAFVIDRLIISGILSLLGIVAKFVFDTFRLNEWLVAEGWGQVIVLFLITAVAFAVPVFYNIVFWLLAGQTPGKRLMGIRIVRADGTRVRLGNAIRRQAGYWISAVLGLGYLWILIDNKRRGWHDMLAGTMVVYSWPDEGVTPIRDRMRRFRERRGQAQSDPA
jgi:uncharacterized RDD family membrane protein YckC